MSFYFQAPENRVYFDHNATAPLAAHLTENLLDWSRHWGNPSSIHMSGRGPKALIRQARDQVAKMIGAHTLEIIFTSGGSEANNLCLKGWFETCLQNHPEKKRIFCSAVEHPSVVHSLRSLEKRGAEITVIPVSRKGELDLEFLTENLDEKTALVSVMYANNETGHIHPIKKVVKICKTMGVKVHCDAVQALGKCPVDVTDWGVDFASFSGHKFYSLKGVGVAYCKTGVELQRQIDGGGQERHRRAGTENVLAIASLGEMAQMADQIGERSGFLKQLRDDLQQKITHSIEGVVVNAESSKRIPNTLSLCIDGVNGESLLMNLDMAGISISTGAACSAGSPEPSPVLLAMGLTHAEAQSSLRISLGWGNTQNEVDHFVKVLIDVVQRLRNVNKKMESN